MTPLEILGPILGRLEQTATLPDAGTASDDRLCGALLAAYALADIALETETEFRMKDRLADMENECISRLKNCEEDVGRQCIFLLALEESSNPEVAVAALPLLQKTGCAGGDKSISESICSLALLRHRTRMGLSTVQTRKTILLMQHLLDKVNPEILTDTELAVWLGCADFIESSIGGATGKTVQTAYSAASHRSTTVLHTILLSAEAFVLLDTLRAA